LAMRTIEDSSEPHLKNRLGKLIPPSQGKSPFSLDGYLSWMSPEVFNTWLFLWQMLDAAHCAGKASVV
jgi:hypothetical protein